ncbi:MAG: hypothetical protein IBX64_09180 [Actinobacteria bacterium]|nr:hypothetical protein [Actinomycetota bacterium]
MERTNASNKKLENALDYSIRLLNSGASIDDCLRMYPNQRRELKDLLEAAACIKSAYPDYPELRPSKLYIKAGREKFLAAIEGGVPSAVFKTGRGKVLAASSLSSMRGLYKKAAIASTAAAAALLITMGGLAYASGDSMPGNPLYGIKRIVENAQLALAFDSESRARLHFEFAQRRIAEARYMAGVGEHKEAARISKEAKINLTEAKKVAKVITPAEQSNIEHAIESLDIEAADQSVKDAKPDASPETTPDTSAETTATGNLELDTKVALGSDSTSSVSDNSNQIAIRNRRVSRTDRTVTSDKSLASITPFQVDSISVSSKYISPNGDGVKDTVLIRVDGATEESFTVELYKGSTKVAVIAKQASGKDLEMRWNGKDIEGNRLPDGEYSIVVSNSTGQVARRRAGITVDTVPPSITLIEPPDTVETSVLKPRFVWKANEDIESYTLRLSLDGVDIKFQGITNDFYLLDRALFPGNWRWRVSAIDKAGNVGKSAVRSILIAPEVCR